MSEGDKILAAAALFARAVGALGKIEALRAENRQREINGHSLAYDDAAFFSVVAEFKLSDPATIACSIKADVAGNEE